MKKPKLPDAKILVLDLEWKPTKAYTWQAWKVNIFPEQIIEHGGLLCIGLKWVGDKRVTLLSEWEHGHEEMVRLAHEAVSQADAIVGYNSDKYDLRKLEGEFLLAKLPPPPPPTSIDLIKTVRKMGFFMNRLGFIGAFLGIGSKLEHEGFALWKKVEAGDAKAQARMARYCVQDVNLTEQLYLRLRPYIKNHPHMGNTKSDRCGACGSKHLQNRGFYRTKMFRVQRVQCQKCGSWSTGRREKIG